MGEAALTPFRELVAFARGGGWGTNSEEVDHTRVRVIRGTDFPRIREGDVANIPTRWERTSKIVSRKLWPGDVLIEMAGGSATSGQTTGRSLYVDDRLLAKFKGEVVIPASFCRLLRFDISRVLPAYAYWGLQDMYLSGRAGGYEHQSTGLSNFQFEYFLDSELLRLPPLSEQRAIAEVLGALDDKIEANQRVSSLLESRLSVSFASGGFDEEGDYPVRLTDLVEIGPVRPKATGDTTPYVDMAALPTDSALVAHVSERPPKSGTRFVNGDTLMARITPCLENGKVAYVDCLDDGQTGVGSTEFIVLRPRDPLPTQFTYFLARSERFAKYAVRHMSGSSGRQRCPAEAVERYEITRPDPTVLAGFSALAEPSFASMRASLNESLLLTSLRDTLLPKLLSGELRVRDVEELVAGAV